MFVRNRSGLTAEPFGVNLFGFVTGNLGLGVAARTSATLLAGRGVPTVLTDVDPGQGRAGHDTTHVVRGVRHDDPTPHPVNLFHLNPPELRDALRAHPTWVDRDRVSASYTAWELPSLPPSWVAPLRAMDIVLAPSRFVQRAVEAACPDALCVRYRQAVVVAEDVAPDRCRWGFPDRGVVFVFSFDMNSDIERKNPEAVVRAFHEAFPGRDDVHLVLKVNSAPRRGAGTSGRFDRLVDGAARDPRIRVVTDVLPYRDVLSLYASADVLVSMHRSEGFGRSLMEAMTLGRPVIATGWSGNMDFMTAENSMPVRYTLVPVASDHPSYRREVVGEDAYWAEPSVEDCARSMRLLADEPALRRSIGETARRDMRDVRAAVEGGEMVDALRSALDPGSAIWAHHHERRVRLRRLVRTGPGSRAGRAYRALPPGVRVRLGRVRAAFRTD